MAAGLEPLEHAGVACRLVVSRPGLVVVEASGACSRLLGREPRTLVGQPLGHLVEGIAQLDSPERGACEVVASASSQPLLAFWASAGERSDVLLLDASLLPGRPADSSADFAGAAAHDLRNPLATVKLNLQVLARQLSPGDARAEKRLAIALREVEVLEHGLDALSECGRARAAVGLRADLSRVLAEAARRLPGERVRVEAEAGLPLLDVEESRLAVAVACLARLVARDGGDGEVVLLGRVAAPGRVRVEVRKAGFEAPTRRSLAFFLAQRVAEDARGRFFVDRNLEGAALVLELNVPG
ncbi:MAG: histidine kinase dimerization/phospho-acceptor domain-containing protein [Myxococcales bacterium]